jgi:hypothetical protein
MATNLQVANRAIREVGGQPIDELTDNGSSTARIVNDAILFSIEEVLSAFEWTVNIETVESTGSANPLPGSAFIYRHDLTALGNPFDRVLSVFNSDGAQIYEYHIEGAMLYSREASLFIRYAYQLTDVTTLPAFITAVVAAHLAKEICLPLSGDQDKKAFLEQNYEIILGKAKINSLLQNPQQAYIDDSTMRHVQKAAAVSSLASPGGGPQQQRRRE